MSVMENVHTIHRNLSGTGIRFPNHSRNATAPLVHKARVIKLPFQMNLLFYTKKRSIDETKTQLKVTTETENVVFPLKKPRRHFRLVYFFLSLSLVLLALIYLLGSNDDCCDDSTIVFDKRESVCECVYECVCVSERASERERERERVGEKKQKPESDANHYFCEKI